MIGMANLECGGFIFYSNFDSGNLSKVEWVPKTESVNKNGKDVLDIPDIEFNVWTKPDCMGTEFENGNRTWFHFGVKGYLPSVLMKLNLVDLNRQAKMYSQGMAPVFRMVPGREKWERIRDRPTYTVEDNIFTLSFKFKTPEDIDTVMFFAFTYPYTYTELQTNLLSIDNRFITRNLSPCPDDIYYVRELLCRSLENRRIDLITISSYFNIQPQRETKLMYLFPDERELRPLQFKDKKVIFVSARVHPGETPSSFVFNGLLNFLLNREDPIACILRRKYVFKLIPFLNPDGVFKGHYRTDTRGVNLNRMYLNPSLAEHPSIYAARTLILYYHSGVDPATIQTNYNSENKVTKQVEVLSLEEKKELKPNISEPWCSNWKSNCQHCDKVLSEDDINVLLQCNSSQKLCAICLKQWESGLFMYLDMHGHASKKGIFMYGNYFKDIDTYAESMLLSKIMSLNNHNFHFTACNFTERNMYLKDRRDGMSREGSGRVAVLKLTGLIRSYTLECNYNSGRLVNVLPPSIKEGCMKQGHTLLFPPKYTPHVFEEVGKAFGASILDLTGNNPYSRIPNSEFHTLNGIRDWLKQNCLQEVGFGRGPRNNKGQNQNQNFKSSRGKSKALGVKARPSVTKYNKKPLSKNAPVPIDRKENMTFASQENTISHASSSYPITSSCNRIVHRTSSKAKGLPLRGKMKSNPDSRNKFQMLDSDTSKISNRSVQTSSTSFGSLTKFKSEGEIATVKKNMKRAKVVPDANTADRLKLREICFVKENLTKKLIAKFSSTESSSQETHDNDDDLVVAWDPTFSPKILTKNDGKPGTSRKHDSIKTRPSSSKPSFKTNTSVNKIGTKKRGKGTLRRLTNTNLDLAEKIGIVKKRKKKSKII